MSIRRRILQQSIALGASAWITRTASAHAASTPSAISTHGSDGRNDFDFFIGQWSVAARRLRHRLSSSAVWEEVKGTTRVISILQGTGNLDEDEFQLPGSTYIGGMLRLFDAGKNLWTTFGMSRDDGALQSPLYGRFNGACGEFFGKDVENGRPIRVRHLYLNQTPTACRWEQAFSMNDGMDWETNWVIDFTRAAQPVGW